MEEKAEKLTEQLEEKLQHIMLAIAQMQHEIAYIQQAIAEYLPKTGEKLAQREAAENFRNIVEESDEYGH